MEIGWLTMELMMLNGNSMAYYELMEITVFTMGLMMLNGNNTVYIDFGPEYTNAFIII